MQARGSKYSSASPLHQVYEGVYCMAIRDFKKAASLFLDTISTFTSYELMDYNK